MKYISVKSLPRYINPSTLETARAKIEDFVTIYVASGLHYVYEIISLDEFKDTWVPAEEYKILSFDQSSINPQMLDHR